MAGLETLAIVCSIFQVISFSRETISLCKKVYHTGSSVDPELAENAVFLDRFSSQIYELDTANVRSRDDQQLYDVLKKCQAASRDLQEEVGFITGHAKKGSLVSILKISAKTNWRKRRLETLERKLGDIQRLVETGLLVRICNRIDLTQPKLDALDADLRLFLLNYQAGQRTVTGLISTELLRTRHQISSEVSRLESSVNLNTAEVRHFAKDIKGHVSEAAGATMATLSKGLHDLQLNEKRQEHRRRFLKCLKFPGMNERRHQVTESFPQTFRWAFGEDEVDEDEVDEDEVDEDEVDEDEVDEDEVDEDEVDEDGNNKDGSIKPSNPESNELRALRGYKVISASGICDTPWDNFGDWLRSDSPVYWISGKPGAGKTTLVKYFLSNARTKVCLGVWNSETVLVSHFFWRPGSPMQQNVKGLLCSLLYQLVEANDGLIEYITTHFNNVMRKDTYTDWAILELKQVCLQTLQNFGRPLCIFIDGLDEVDPRDGIFELFEVVDMIKQSPSTKLCLSSRAEPPIVKRVGKYPQLRIQDLTQEDLWTYAEGRLQFPNLYSGNQYERARHKIIRELVRKAEGVFLWLCLAVKSLNAGLDNEDHLKEVAQRAESLPPDLARLYMDMWTRFNEDHVVYRQSAALYLKLVIASLKTPWERWEGGPRCLTQSNITVFEMAIAMASPEFRLELAIPTAENLAHSCSNTIRLIQTRCAGLLEIVVQPVPTYLSGERRYPRADFSTVIPFGDGSQTIRFIHRTAFDFLTETAEGGVILSADVTSEQSLYMKLFRAGLSTRYLLRDCVSKRASSLEMYTEELSKIWHLEVSCQNSALNAQLQEIATFLELSGSSGALTLYWGDRHNLKILQKDEFFVYAACFGLSRCVMEVLVKREICNQRMSDILLAISARIAGEFNSSQDDIALAENLLDRGADPNYKGSVLTFNWNMGLNSWPIASPFSEFLAGVMCANLHFATKLSIQRVCHALDIFLAYGANTSDLVNLNIDILNPGEVEFVSLKRMYILLEIVGLDEKEDERCKFCSLLVPAYIIIDALLYQLEEAICKTGHSQEKYCNLDHLTSIRAKARLFDRAVKPRIIALATAGLYCRTVSDEDSVYLSDAVVIFLANPRSPNVKAMLRDRFLEVYQRSKTIISTISALLKEEGLIWDVNANGHELHEECTCSQCL